MTRPAKALMDLITGSIPAQAVHVAAKLGIADLLAAGPRAVDDLARATETDAAALHRVLRALASLGVFVEVEPSRFALTPAAEPLRTDAPGSLRAFAIFFGDEMHWRPYGEILHSVRTGEPAFEKVWGAPAFAWLAKRPEKAAIFDAAMTALSEVWAPAVAESYDFSPFRAVADVGGGQGALLSAILRRNPHLEGVLFDLPHVLGDAKARIEAEGLAGRCRTLPGDFFDSIPGGTDCIVSKNCIHDWDDERAVAILQNCRMALPEGGRILIVENVVQPGNARDAAKILDIEMLVMAGGRERTEAEFRDLYAAAGFRLTRVIPTACPLFIIEGERV